MKNYTYFKAIYFRYTHFSKENIIENFDNDPEWNSNCYCKISKVGDIIKNMCLKIDIKINDQEYKNINDKEYLYSDAYLTDFLFKYENELNVYINKISSLFIIKDKFKEILDELKLSDMIEVLNNFLLNSNKETTSSSLDIEIDEVHTSSTSINLNTIQNEDNFILDLNLLNNEFINNNFVNNDEILIDVKYKNINKSFPFTKWQYFKLYHFMEYYNAINDLNYSYENDNLNSDMFKKEKIAYIKKLEIFKILDKRKSIKWNPFFGHNLFEKITLEIGNETIVEYCNLFYDIYANFHKKFNTDIYKEMIFIEKDNIITVYIPLLINNNFLIPCVSLKYNEIILNVKFNSLEKLCDTNCENITIDNIQLYIDYIYLSKKERDLYCTQSLYYLVHTTEKIQRIINNNDFTIIDLEFNNICKQLFWFIYDDKNKKVIDSEENSFELILENEIVGNKFLDNKYYSYVEPWKSLNYFPKDKKNKYMLYNFCLYPDNYQPSGFIDFKNFKSKKLLFKNNDKLYSYQNIILINYGIKIFKVENGFLTSIIS